MHVCTQHKLMADEDWKYIFITAPESASILLEAWEAASKPDLRYCILRYQ